jgi:hypothetical protein
VGDMMDGGGNGHVRWSEWRIRSASINGAPQNRKPPVTRRDHGWHKKSFEDFAGGFSSSRLAALHGAGSHTGHSIQNVARPFGMRRIGS